MTKIPSIQEFNKWTIKQRVKWIDYESGGKFRQYKRDQGYFPLIIYDAEDVGIIYEVNERGYLAYAEAMTIKEATDRLMRFKAASDAVMSAATTS